MAAIVSIPEDSDFPLANIPFGVISTANNVSDISFIAISESIYCDVNIVAELIHIQPEKRCATRIGDHVVDLAAVAALGLFDGPKLKTEATRVFAQPTLNEFMRLGRAAWQEARAKLQTVLAAPSTSASVHTALVPLAATTVHLPAHIGDYTDFYSSREHAFNVGVMFRGRDNALQPNYLRLPVGYHGRASSIVLSGTSLSRPCGLIQDPVSKDVFFSESKKLDYELETAFFIGAGNSLGDPIAIDNAEDHIFGMVLMNDWSARDIQAFEYVPLGPFLGKNFGTTISPWIVTLDALEPFRVPQPIQDPAPAAYLKPGIRDAYDIQLHATLTPKHSSKKYMLSKTNFKYLYWTMKQQLAHHTVNGCNMLPGDLLGSGTISGPDPTSLGSLLEASLNGKQDVILSADGSVTRRFIEDGDSLSITGKCEKVINGKRIRIGFGVCEGTILPAKKFEFNK
ncbi:hypothetical protein HK100_012313 [Physocladia obscura]|uniref:Fumarylacetoacetase n=1 Tax=Physocladia obscura TaxID=109957 RepID=A0AAD5XKJ6_9FUNG|nr:hypothetical protein HK100_012313 [Physocladia obscura]